MANKFQIKRTTTSGRTPNTTNSGNSYYIDTGELAINLTDGRLFSSNGSALLEFATIGTPVYDEGGNLITNTYIQVASLAAVNTDIIPISNNTFNIGNNTNRFANLYLSGNTIILGDTSISVGESNILFAAKSTTEGGQITLKKGTSQTYATHLDNYTDSFRVLTGSDAGSNSSQLELAHATGYLKVPGVYSATVGATNRDVFVDDSGLVGYVSSVRASKANIEQLLDIEWLLELEPVSFERRIKDSSGNYTDELEQGIDYGLIAEQAEAVNPELCFYDVVDGKRVLRGVSYTKLITPMLKMIQNLKAEIEDLKIQVKTRS